MKTDLTYRCFREGTGYAWAERSLISFNMTVKHNGINSIQGRQSLMLFIPLCLVILKLTKLRSVTRGRFRPF